MPPGVVIDTGAVHPVAQDFYINTYAGIQGSNNLLHIRVLLDECCAPDDVLKSMSASLAYMYPKADRAIKITSVVYFAKMVRDSVERQGLYFVQITPECDPVVLGRFATASASSWPTSA